MQPLLHPADVILVRLQGGIKRDSIVVARTDEGFVVKRVGKISRNTLELLSINPHFPSKTIPLADEPVLGPVVLCWCGHFNPP
jgi:phage repressor protein C with HTH and peptisase S24 domain